MKFSRPQLEKIEASLIYIFISLVLSSNLYALYYFFHSVDFTPALDSWGALAGLALADSPFSFGWSPYEDHRPVVPTLLLYAALRMAWASEYFSILPQFISLVLAISLLLFVSTLNPHPRLAGRSLVFAFLVAGLLHSGHAVVLALHWRTWVLLSFVFSVGAGYLLAVGVQRLRDRAGHAFFALAVTAATISSLCGAPGLLAWGVLLGFSVVLRAPAALSVLLAGLAIGAYLFFRTRPEVNFFATSILGAPGASHSIYIYIGSRPLYRHSRH